MLSLRGFQQRVGAKAGLFAAHRALDLEIDATDELRKLGEDLKIAPRELLRLQVLAINDTLGGRRGGRRGLRQIVSSKITQRINIKKRDVESSIYVERSTTLRPTGVLRIAETRRLDLRYFGARQTRRGVSYRIERQEGRKLAKGAFVVQRFGGNVYMRGVQIEGWKGRMKNSRLPIFKLRGPSAWGVFVKAGLENETVADATQLLQTNLRDRLRYFRLQSQRQGGGTS